MTDISRRKAEHLDLCATDEVTFRQKPTLLDAVELLHDALPELSIDEIDTSARVCGKVLRAPLIIAAMTGGVDQAEAVNRDLAVAAQEHGIGLGFGSMRPLFERGQVPGYRVRDVAPDILLLGNIGVVQAKALPTGHIQDVLGQTGCDALCVHLNAAMEVIQSDGDRNFRGAIDTIIRLREELDIPVIVKETGCGLSRAVALRLVSAGIRWVDTSGAGGTSWVGVETLRARSRSRELGERFWDWGIPTAASVVQLSGLGLGIIATGGVRHGLDVVRALALGATAGGIARPFLQAWNQGGVAAVSDTAAAIAEEIRLAMLLTGAQRIDALRSKRIVLDPALLRWIPAESPLLARLASA